jgi:RHS repeat-associated protein
LGSTSVVANYEGTVFINGGRPARQGYKAWGEQRFPDPVNGSPLPTTFRYTGQREDSYITAGLADQGLYWMGARLYDPALGRFIQPDAIVPGVGENGNPNAIGYVENSTYTPLTVDYHENQLVNKLNEANKKQNPNNDQQSSNVPTNSIAFDRYAYSFDDPIKYIDPTGHRPVASDYEEWLKWLEQIKIIWNHPPGWAQGLFTSAGRRIIMIDHPHGSLDFWHLNTDLRALQSLNHQNIEGVVAKAAVVKTTVDSAASTASNVVKAAVGAVGSAASNIANSPEILFLENIPLLLFSPSIVPPSAYPIRT